MKRSLVLASLSLVLLPVALSVARTAESGFVSPLQPPPRTAAGSMPSMLPNPGASPATLDRLAESALAADPRARTRALTALREAGPAGLEALLRVHAAVLAAGSAHPQWSRLTDALDRVAAQRDAHAARLYWYTDLDEARAAARASGRPILSLRLLGRLDEEMSCANSRLFRSVLYANHEVGRALRERFILHWRSVRPAPKVRVDFGDGRVLERTVTGNSIHYVLDADGRPVEAIPGLWGPQAFLEELERAEAMARQLSALDPARRAEELRRYHARRAAEIDLASRAAASEVGFRGEAAADLVIGDEQIGQPGIDAPPSALRAGRETATKMMVERPLLNTLSRSDAPDNGGADAALWSRLGERERATVRLDQGTAALIASKLALPQGDDEDARRARAERLSSVLASLRASVALDQARNRFRIQRAIHEWLAASLVPDELEPLNERIYAELFLTPGSDPWLGLVPDDAYAGIAGEGMRWEGTGMVK